MSWAHIQDTPGSNAVNATGSGTSQALTAFASAVTIGDQVLVFAWGTSAATIVAANITCTDNGSTPNTYTQLAVQINAGGGARPWCAIFGATITHNPSSGNLVVTIKTASVTSGINGCASEFSGGSLTTDGSSTNSNSGSTGPNPGNITTTVASDLLLAIFTDSSGLNPETITGPGGYTSIGIQKNGSSFDCGNGIYEIPGSIVTNNNPTWTLGDSVGWAAAQVALKAAATTANPPPALSQRIDPLPDLTSWWEQFLSPRRLPPSASPVTPNIIPSQRYDPLPIYDYLWWEAAIRFLLPPSASPVPTNQPSQRYDPLPDFSFSWWESFDSQIKLLPTSASPVPTAEPSERFDTLPDLNSAWWEIPLIPHALPPSASIVPTAQPSQRVDPLSDFWQGGVPWQTFPKQTTGSAVVVTPYQWPTTYQRYDIQPDFGFSWWEPLGPRLVVSGPPIPPPAPTPGVAPTTIHEILGPTGPGKWIGPPPDLAEIQRRGTLNDDEEFLLLM